MAEFDYVEMWLKPEAKQGKNPVRYYEKDANKIRVFTEYLNSKNDQPALIYYKDGKIIERHWYKDGKMHREGSPASILNYTDLTLEAYYTNDLLDREDGPAYIETCDEFVLEIWHKNGRFHREDGPAKIETHGSYKKVDYFLNGKRLVGKQLEDFMMKLKMNFI